MTVYTAEMCGDKFEIKADFSQASCPISGDHSGRQVADFRHDPRSAMEAQLEYYMLMSGESRDEDGDWDENVSNLIKNALDEMVSRDTDLIEMAEMLTRHGDRFSGNNADDEAQNWLDNDFDSADADEWCEIGVWDAATAAELRDAGLTPSQAKAGAESLVDDVEDAAEIYTDGDPIYSVCNNDTAATVIIDAAKSL